MYPPCTPYVYCAYSSYVAYAEAAPHDPKLAGTFRYRPEVMVCPSLVCGFPSFVSFGQQICQVLDKHLVRV